MSCENTSEIYRQVFENNRRWVEEMRATDADFFQKLAKDQNPDFLYIGCADSRVPANVIMGMDPGDVFVHRNIANLVLHTDLNVQSVIEYAVTHLQVKHVVVCGHYGCGGVAAAMQPADLGVLNPWLREIRDVCRNHQHDLAGLEGEERARKLVELNVQEQCINVIKTAAVLKQYQRNKFPVVHAWVYDLGEGLIHELPLDFEGIVAQVREIYTLEG